MGFKSSFRAKNQPVDNSTIELNEEGELQIPSNYDNTSNYEIDVSGSGNHRVDNWAEMTKFKAGQDITDLKLGGQIRQQSTTNWFNWRIKKNGTVVYTSPDLTNDTMVFYNTLISVNKGDIITFESLHHNGSSVSIYWDKFGSYGTFSTGVPYTLKEI